MVMTNIGISFALQYTPHLGDDFIVRWGFQKMCDHVFDPRTVKWAHPTSTEVGGVRCNPEAVKMGDTIFVRDIELFMKEMHPLIKVPYIIVTHGEFRDTCMEYHLTFLEDEKIIAWFSIHPPKQSHSKFFPIPLGISQGADCKDPSLNNFFIKCRTIPKTGLAYLNWSIEQNPERAYVGEVFKDRSDLYFRSVFLPFKQYLEEMAHYKFALSPRGWGPDCYRTWEALLVGTIPIVRRCQFDQYIVRGANVVDPGAKCSLTSQQGSELDKLYQDLPVLVIDRWEELTPEFLTQKYSEITSKTYSLEKLYLAYWQSKIQQVKMAYLGIESMLPVI
jgi:hypothetical protein